MGVLSAINNLAKDKEKQQKLGNAVSTLTSYQKNLATPAPQETPTTRGMLGRIANVMATDMAQGQSLFEKLRQYQSDPSTPVYNPFLQATNPSIQTLANLGFDVSNIDDKWFDDNAYLMNYYETSNTTNNVKAPTKKSSTLSQAAYAYNQLLDARETSNKARQELNAAMEEAATLAQMPDRNYSDDQIVEMVYGNEKKYPTLAKMEKSKLSGEPIELNFAVPYSKDALYGAVWMGRNPDYKGDLNGAMANSYNGVGNVWKEDTGVQTKLTKGDQYAPYSLGSTLDAERLYYKQLNFTNEWVDANYAKSANSQDETERKMYSNVWEANEATKVLEAEQEALYNRFNELVKQNYTARQALDEIKKDTKSFGHLFKLDETMKNPNADLVKTTRPINYKWEDFEKNALDWYADQAKGSSTVEFTDEMVKSLTGTPSPAQTPAASPVTTPAAPKATPATTPAVSPAPTTAQVTEQAEKENIEAVTPAIAKNGTDEQKLIMEVGRSLQFAASVATLQQIVPQNEALRKSAADSLAAKTSETYIGDLRVIRDYEQTESALKQSQDRLHFVMREYNTLNNRFEKSGNVNAFDTAFVDWIQNDPDWEEIKANIQSDDAGKKAMGYQAFNGKMFEGQFAAVGYHEDIFSQMSVKDGKLQGVPEKIERLADAAIKGEVNPEGNTPLTAAEEDTMFAFEEEMGELQEEIRSLTADLNGKQKAYNDAKNDRDRLLTSYAENEKVFGDQFDKTLLDDIDTAYQLSQTYDAPTFTADNVYDMAVDEGVEKSEVVSQARLNMAGGVEALERLKRTMGNIDRYKIPLSADERKNLQQRITNLEREVYGNAAFLLDEQKDFEKIAREQMSKGYEDKIGGYSDLTKANIDAMTTGYLGNWLDNAPVLAQYIPLDEFQGQIVNDPGNRYLIADVLRSINEREKLRYFYLLSEEGEDAANRYFQHLVNPDYGALWTRSSEDRSEELSKKMSQSGWNALGGYALSFVTNVRGNMEAALTSAEDWITGKTSHPFGEKYAYTNFTTDLRGGALDYLHKKFGESEFLDTVFNAGTSAVDSMISSLLTTGGMDFLGEALPVFKKIQGFLETAGSGKYGGLAKFGANAISDWEHAIPMALGAAAQRDREAVIQGATPEQRRALFLSTFFAESVSEALTYGNIKGMFEKGSTEALKGFFTSLLSNGMEEALGEGFNQWWENNAETAILGEKSEYGRMLDYYMNELKLPKSVAEDMAAEQMTKSVLLAAASGFISSGFSSTSSYVAGNTVNAIRSPYSASDIAKRDTSLLNAASLNNHPTNAAISIAVVLGTDMKAEDAKAVAQHIVGGGSVPQAVGLMQGIVADGNPQGKQAVAYAAMTSGTANRTLQDIAQKAKEGLPITEADVNNLVAAVAEDKSGPNAEALAKEMKDKIRENRIANKTLEKAATPANKKALDDQQAKVDEAQKKKDEADAKLEDTKGQLVTATQNAQDAITELENNPQDTSNIGTVQQTAEQVAALQDKVQEETKNSEDAAQEVAKAEEEQTGVESTIVAQATEEATVETDQEIAAEEEAQAQQEQQEFEQALQAYHPSKPFSHPVTVDRVNSEGAKIGDVQITGVFAALPDGTVIYSTMDGYISDKETGDIPNDALPQLDAALNSWYSESGGFIGANPVNPAVWFNHSIKLTGENEGVTIIGIAGIYNDGPVLMDDHGKLYSDEDVNTNPADGAMVYDVFDQTEDLPEISGNEIYQNTSEGVQMPEGFVAYPGPATPMTDWINNEDHTIVGYVYNDADGIGLVTDQGQVIPITNFSGGTSTQNTEEAQNLENWAIDQVGEQLVAHGLQLTSENAEETVTETTEPIETNEAAEPTETVETTETAEATPEAETQSPALGDEYSLGKKNPKTNAPLKNWQDPKYHGEAKMMNAKRNPKTAAFKAWQGLDNIKQEYRRFFVNPDGSPKVYYRGFGKFSHFLRVAHDSHPQTTSDGKTFYVNFYMDKLSTAADYAGTSKVLKLTNIKNWETAAKAMEEVGLKLVEEESPTEAGRMGYRVYRTNSYGTDVPVEGKDGDTTIIPWFAENELSKFKKTYGGSPRTRGVLSGYVSAENPLVIDGHGHSYSNVTADVTAPDGSHMSGTMKTRLWAEWAFKHGYDMLIVDNVKDSVSGGGPVGVEVVTSQPQQFKSVYNEGGWSKTKANILALMNMKSKVKSNEIITKPKSLAELMGVKELSPQFNEIIARFQRGEDVPQEELEATPEFKWARKNQTPGSTVSRALLKRIQQEGDGQITDEAVQLLLPDEIVDRIYRIKAELDKTGSAEFDNAGETHYTGEVEQGKRLDLMFGLAASGKSTIADYLSNKYKSRFFDSDMAKALHPENRGGINEDYVHNESKIINDLRLSEAAKRGDNALFSVIGDNLESVQKRIQPFLDAGYEIHIHMTDLNKNKAIGRVLGRMAATGRFLDFTYLRKIDPNNILATFEALKGDADIAGYARWNTDIPKGSRPIPVDYSDDGEIDIFRGGLLGRSELGNALAQGTESDGNGPSPGSDNGGSGGGLNIQPLKATPATPTQKQNAKVKKKLNSPQQIAKTLIDSLGFGNYMGSNNFGNLPKAVRAYWERHGRLVAVRDRDIGNYTVTMHEIGHGVAQRLGLRGTDQMVNNLIAEAPEFAQAYSPNQLKDEAFAEFMWRYMADDQQARDFAGDVFVDDFERRLAKDPGTLKALRDAQNDLRQFLNAELSDQLDATIAYENRKTRVPLIKQFKALTTRNVDKTAIADAVDAFVGQETGNRGKLRLQALFAGHSQKRAVTNLTRSLTNANGTRIGDGLAKRLQDVGFNGTEENIHLLEKYALLLHSMSRDEQGKPVFADNFTQDQRKAEIQKIKNEHPEIPKAEKAWQSFRHDFLKAWMVDTGYWSEEFLDHLEKMYPHYVPTFRVRGDMDNPETTGYGKSSRKYTMKAALGGSEDIYSPMYSFIGMVDQITTMVGNNQVAQLFDQYYQDTPGMGEFARMIPGDENTTVEAGTEMNARQKQLLDLLGNEISDDLMEQVLAIAKSQPGVNQSGRTGGSELAVQREDGTVVKYEIRDPELYKLLSGVQGSTGIRAMQLIGNLTRTMSMLTTGSNPLFAVRNAARDYQNSVNYGSWASNYLSGIPKWLSALADVIRDSDVYQEYQALGGGGWTRIQRGNAQNMRQITTEMFGDDKSNVGKTAKWLMKKVWNTITMERLNEVIEQASRLAEYKYGQHDRSTEEGRMEAFQAAQDATVDFSRSGNSETAYVLKKLVPFFGASLQGVYRTGRTLTEAERGRLGARVTKTIVNQALASALAAGLILRSGDDDDKEEFLMLSDGVKANHLILPNPLKGQPNQPPYLRIPLAQDPLSYAVHSLVTNAMINGSEDDMAINLAATADVILDNLNPLGSGTIFQPFVDVSHNRTWYGTPVVRNALKDLKDKASQYDSDTPMAFRWLGRLVDESPEVLEYLATQYTGFLGSMAIPALSIEDDGEVGGLDAILNSIIKKWTSDPLTSNDLTNSFYDMAGTDGILQTIIDEAKQERPQGLFLRSLTQEQVNEAYDEAKAMMSSGGIAYETKKVINDAYKQIDQINGNESLTDDQKYKLTREVRDTMLQQVKAANDAFQTYYKKYIQGETLTDRIFGGIRKRFEEGKYAHIKEPVEKLHETFQTDIGNAAYMERSMSVYEDSDAAGYHKEAALPHPSRTFSKNKTDYEIPDDEWPNYINVYKTAYAEYIADHDDDWDMLPANTRYEILQDAHQKANQTMKKLYFTNHGIQ